MPGEVDEPEPSLERADLRRQPRHLGVRRFRCAKGAIEPPLEFDDPAAEGPGARVNLGPDLPERARLLLRQLEPVGELEGVSRAGVVVELGREGVTGPLAGEQLVDALGGDRLDLPLLEAAIGLRARLVSLARRVLAFAAAGRAGYENESGDARG